MNFDDWLSTAWDDHSEHAAEVAQRIADSLDIVTTAAQAPPFAALAAHVLGEHLGSWREGIAVIETLARLDVCQAAPQTQRALTRQQAALEYAAGVADRIDSLADDERSAALAAAAAMLTGRGDWPRAIAAFDAALEAAAGGLPDRSPAQRALAVAGNNLAAALEEKPERDAEQTRAMRRAAQAGLRFWRVAGGWLEEERAEYRLARTCLQCADVPAAQQAAQRCLAVCEANAAPAFERFFAHAAIALAHRASGEGGAFAESRERALALLAEVPADERLWCDADLAELNR